MKKNVNIETQFSKRDIDELLFCSVNYQHEYVYRVRGQLCRTEFDFFREISAGMSFPEYFGWNWNALDECLTDLEWLRFSGILMVIDDWQMAFEGEKDQKESVDVMKRCLGSVAEWWRERGVQFTVYYNQTMIIEENDYDRFRGTSLTSNPKMK